MLSNRRIQNHDQRSLSPPMRHRDNINTSLPPRTPAPGTTRRTTGSRSQPRRSVGDDIDQRISESVYLLVHAPNEDHPVLKENRNRRLTFATTPNRLGVSYPPLDPDELDDLNDSPYSVSSVSSIATGGATTPQVHHTQPLLEESDEDEKEGEDDEDEVCLERDNASASPASSVSERSGDYSPPTIAARRPSIQTDSDSVSNSGASSQTDVYNASSRMCYYSSSDFVASRPGSGDETSSAHSAPSFEGNDDDEGKELENRSEPGDWNANVARGASDRSNSSGDAPATIAACRPSNQSDSDDKVSNPDATRHTDVSNASARVYYYSSSDFVAGGAGSGDEFSSAHSAPSFEGNDDDEEQEKEEEEEENRTELVDCSATAPSGVSYRLESPGDAPTTIAARRPSYPTDTDSVSNSGVTSHQDDYSIASPWVPFSPFIDFDAARASSGAEDSLPQPRATSGDVATWPWKEDSDSASPPTSWNSRSVADIVGEGHSPAAGDRASSTARTVLQDSPGARTNTTSSVGGSSSITNCSTTADIIGAESSPDASCSGVVRAKTTGWTVLQDSPGSRTNATSSVGASSISNRSGNIVEAESSPTTSYSVGIQACAEALMALQGSLEAHTNATGAHSCAISSVGASSSTNRSTTDIIGAGYSPVSSYSGGIRVNTKGLTVLKDSPGAQTNATSSVGASSMPPRRLLGRCGECAARWLPLSSRTLAIVGRDWDLRPRTVMRADCKQADFHPKYRRLSVALDRTDTTIQHIRQGAALSRVVKNGFRSNPDSEVELSTLEKTVSPVLNGKILSAVFGFLKEKELLWKASQVCSVWADFAHQAHVNLVLAAVETTDTSIAESTELDSEKLIDRYPRGQYLSEGAMKMVYKVYNKKTQQEEAISVINVNKVDDKRLIAAELAVSCLMSYLPRRGICPNFVTTRGFFTCTYGVPAVRWGSPEHEQPQGDRYNPSSDNEDPPEAGECGIFQCIRMEFCNRGDVEEYIKQQDETKLSKENSQAILLQGAFALHAAGVLHAFKHNDMKLLNIFVKELDG